MTLVFLSTYKLAKLTDLGRDCGNEVKRAFSLARLDSKVDMYTLNYKQESETDKIIFNGASGIIDCSTN